MSIGKNIKKLRIANGMEQSQIAKIAGVTNKAVSAWENELSVPRMGAIQKIADYFGILKSDIIEDKDASISAYNGTDPLKKEISSLVSNILNNTDDISKLKLLKNVIISFKD